MVADIVFYTFATVVVAAALGVVMSRNPVHSVMLLVLAFFTTAGLFVLLGAEFLAAILVMVYMGAVAVLFLFVVMMLDIDFAELRRGAIAHLPLGLTVGLVLLVEMVVVVMGVHVPEVAAVVDGPSNTLGLGRLLFSVYLYPFEIASLVLLVALVGAVVLTLRGRRESRRQDVGRQLARQRRDALELRKVAPGEGAKR
ncbi:MAG: NADH-quinone oxidoreductase subunit J [Magnetococcales bacterium]|nr:NADH-quinone oxidoreductase subunit J [Magnetococcales bacterium]